MSTTQLFVAHLIRAGILVTLIALVRRGHHRRCWSFSIYLVAILIGNTLSSFWPQLFHTPEFWMLKQALYDALKLLVGVEIMWRGTKAFPGARARGHVLLLVVLLLGAAVILATPSGSTYKTLWAWQPRAVAAAVWLYTVAGMTVVFYSLPLHPWLKAILLGITPYQLVFVTWLGILRNRGWEIGPIVGMVDAVAYLLVVWWWAWSAWRLQDIEELSPDRRRELRLA